MPPSYVLKESAKDREYWETVMPALRDALLDIAVDKNLGPCVDMFIGQSLTEWETRAALSDDKALARCMWFRRDYEGEFTLEKDSRKFYSDVYDRPDIEDKLQNFKNFIESRLGVLSKNAIVSAPMKVDSIFSEDADWSEYLAAFKTILQERFRNELKALILKKQNWRKDAMGMGLKGEDADEFLHHARLAAEKCYDFEGRTDIVQKALGYITTPKVNYAAGNNLGIAVCLIGVSGTGKTALMAKVASLTYFAEKKHPRARPLIIRLCGTSNGSSTGLKLIRSICHQIYYCLEQSPPDIPENYRDAKDHFKMLLNKEPVLLFIDSLDQLSDDNLARSQLTFFEGLQPHKNTRIVVSALPDEKDKDGSWIYCYGCDTRLIENKVPRVAVTTLSTSANSESRSMMRNLMVRKARKLTPEQMSYIFENAKVEPTALYFRLAAKIAENWKSYDTVQQLQLQSSVRAVINQIFNSIEKDYGRLLVHDAIGYITFAAGGVNDIEIQDLLSIDDKVMRIVFGYEALTTARLPSSVWARIRYALEGLVVERENGKMFWYHRQLKEAAEKRYTKPEIERLHRNMGLYFGNVLDDALIAQKSLAKQTLSLNGLPVWLAHGKPNKSRSVEAAHHFIEAGMLKEACDELCNLEVLCCCARVGEGYAHIEKLSKLLAAIPADVGEDNDLQALRDKVDHYSRWLALAMPRIIANPAIEIFSTCTSDQPLNSEARMDLDVFLQKPRVKCSISASKALAQEERVLQLENHSSDLHELIKVPTNHWGPTTWLRCRNTGGKGDFESMLLNLDGHADHVNSVAYSKNGEKIASASDDNSVIIWSAITGAKLVTLSGHKKEVNSVAWSPDGSKVASGSADHNVKVFDAVTGAEIGTMIGHKGKVNAVAYSPDGLRIVSASKDKTLKIWNARTFAKFKTVRGHEGAVLCVRFSPDGKMIASGGKDKNVIVWSKEGAVLKILHSHRNNVNSVCFSGDSLRLVSGTPRQNYPATLANRRCRERRQRRESVCG